MNASETKKDENQDKERKNMNFPHQETERQSFKEIAKKKKNVNYILIT